jgi:hypothetical protein
MNWILESRVPTANLTRKAKYAGSGNEVLLPRQSLASQVTSQIAGPEINVTFRYTSKNVRRAWGISQVIIDLIVGWFLKTIQM